MDYLDKLKNLNIVVPGIRDVYSRMADAFMNPSADPAATILSSLFLLNIVAIIAVLVMYFILKRREDMVLAKQVREFEEAMIARNPINIEVLKTAKIESQGYIWLSTILVVAFILFGVSFASEQNIICTSCHNVGLHQTLKKTAVHGDNSCVSCHEPAGFFTKTFATMPARLAHILHYGQSSEDATTQILGLANEKAVAFDLPPVEGTGYGTVSSSACLGCHKKIETIAATNKSTGITMQHRQPLGAGAKCFDCHALSEATGQIIMDKGMDPCLSCHNDKQASTACATCHTKDYASASASRAMVGQRTPLVPEYNCYGCHKPAGCDSCHGGVRLPHSREFMTTSMHAYEGAKSLWSGSAGRCVQCHNDKRRTCTKPGCHVELPYHFKQDPSFRVSHAVGSAGTQSGSSMSCGDCHAGLDSTGKNDPCEGCHRNKGAR